MKLSKILFFLCFISVKILAQNTVNVTVNLVPPYSTRLSDYANQPGKVLITLRNTIARAQSVYLRINITGDNGVQVFTNPNFRASRAVTLQPNAIVTLTTSDLQTLFDVNSLSTRGTTINQIERQNGLPEGTYSVCVRAYDFTRQNVPLSQDNPLGCTTIRLTQLEPPILIKPFADEELNVLTPQNQIFLWTPPAGSPAGTQYQLKIVEMFDPKRNPNDAFLARTNPPFFEKTVNGTTYVYGPADPPLVEGRKYAWAVTALDKVNAGGGRVTTEGSSFRNGGRSEIRSFVYGKNRNTSGLNIPDFAGTKKKDSKPKNQFQIDPDLNLNKLMTTVSGKLYFNFPEDLSLKPDGSIDESKYPNFVQQGNSNAYKIRAINHIKPNLLSKPLANVKITLLRVYAINGVEAKEISSKDEYFIMNQITKNWSILSYLNLINGIGEFINVNDYKFGSESLNNQDFMVPIASGNTDANGNFSLAFMLSDTLKSGVLSIKNPNFISSHTIEKTLILVVENPYYNSPFVMISPLPGDNIQLPDMVSTVRSFGLEITTKNDTKPGQMGGGGGSLENINIEFLRLKHPNANLPSEEGQNLPPSTKSSLKIPDSHKHLLSNNTIERVISLGKTDNAGKIQINRIVRLGNESEQFVAHAFSDKNIGVYSKIDAFKVFDVNKDANFKTDIQGVVLGKDLGIDDLSFNLTYQLKNYKADLILRSAPAVIKGKVVENNLPLKDVLVVLKKRTMALGTGIAKALAYDDTDKDGYFEFKNVEPGDYIIEFVKEGYKLGVFDGSVSSKNETFQATTYGVKNYFTVLFGQLLQTNEIKMVPNGTLVGCVRDEDGNKVIADIKVGNSTIFKNIEKADVKKVEGCFLFSAPSGTQKITLLPRSLEYFPEELTYTINETGITKIPNEKLVVYRKKHRMIFVVMSKAISDVAIPISNAKITVNGKDYITDNKGQVLVEFESPGTQFLVKVKPDSKDNYAVWEKEIAIPVVKKPVSYEIFLDKGKELLATVTELDNGVAKPSKGAKVYIKSLGKNWGSNTSNFTECYTDEKGNCTLRGIPQSENNLKVWVMKDEQTVKTANLIELQKSGTQVSPNTENLQNTVLNPNNSSGNSSSPSAVGSYLGEEKTASWTGSQTKATVNLQLKFEKGLNIEDIWGLPVKIEKIQNLDNNTILASGYFYKLPDNEAFKNSDKNLRLDFANVKMTKTTSGKKTHEPVLSEINIRQSSFSVVIGTQLQGKVTPNASTLNPLLQQEFPYIKVRKNANRGELNGAVELRLSSFEGAYQFSGKFNLAENNNPSGVVIFRAGEAGQRKLQIGTATSADKIEPVRYRVHGFDASSDLSKSYILGDSVKIFTILHTKIPEIQPSDISLEAGFITVLPENILPFAGGNEISFNLEKWKVSGQKSNFYAPTWIFDKINGGLRIPKVLVNTGLVAVSLKNLIIKPDKLIIDPQNFDQQDAKNFTLGGLIPLDIAKGATASFTFDPNAYHDNKPHWKFTLAAPAGVKTAASVSNLDGLEKGQKLEFGTMNLFSDNQQQLNSPSSSLLRFFDILDFKLNTIDVGPNAFTMVGNASLAIPNMKSQNPDSKGVLGQIVYGKNASGQIKASIKPMFFSIEGKGQVRFDASDMVNSQTLTQGKFTSKGKLRIYDTQSGKDFFVDALLSHSKSGNAYTTNITVEPNQKIPLESKYLAIKTGLEYSSMSVISNEWQNLKLTTILPNSGSGGFNQLLNNEKDRTMTFIVKGAIETDPSSGAVGIKGMDTGVGQLSLYYNFQRQEVRGQFLFTPPAPIPLGLFNLNSSNVSMAIGGNGVYIMTNGVGDVAIAGLPLPLTVGYSYIGGYYTKPIYPEDQAIFLSLAVKKSLPEVFQNEIKGMLISGSVSIEPFNDTYSYFDETLQTGAKGKVFVGIAGESRNYFKYNEGTNATIFCGNYSYGGVTIEGSAEILGIGAYAGAHANIQIATEGSINTPDITKGFKAIKESIASLKLEGCGSITMGVFLGVETPLGSAGFNVSKTISARAGYKNQEPYIDFSLNDCGNAMPSDKIKHTVEKTQ